MKMKHYEKRFCVIKINLIAINEDKNYLLVFKFIENIFTNINQVNAKQLLIPNYFPI